MDDPTPDMHDAKVHQAAQAVELQAAKLKETVHDLVALLRRRTDKGAK